mmetsp:Transcript_17313/g.34996  ORF Transcript_17313/g.34996 Transcript_17313/m.34996 type:complete len:140 (-) Transcript_17313:989-1408(-)
MSKRICLYVYLYAHMPIKLAVTVASATARHLASDLADDPLRAEEAAFGRAPAADGATPDVKEMASHATLFALACAATLLQMGALSFLAVEGPTRLHTVMRMASAAILASVALFLPLDATSVLVTVVAILTVNLLFDYVR